MMGNRVSLSVEETDAWLYATFGDEWADHSYHTGAISGIRGRLTTVFYCLYLSEDLQPIAQPQVETNYDMVPV